MLNANAGRGQLRVGVLDESGREVAGLGVEDCVAVEADGIELTAAWRQHRGLSPGRHRLRFELRDAQLFSFRFQP
jgi:hypothetical protein